MRTLHSFARSSRGRIVLLAASFAAAEAAYGQTWTGLAGNGLFSSANNWSPVAVPTSSTTTGLTFSGSTAINATHDLGAFTLNQLTFSNSAATTINASGGSSLNFAGTNPTITKNGAGNATIASPITLGANVSVTGSGTGSLLFSGNIVDPNVVSAGGTLASGTGTGLTFNVPGVTSSFTGGGTFGFVAASRGTVNFSSGNYTLASTQNPGAGPGAGAASALVALSAGNIAGSSGVVNITNGASVSGGNMYFGNFAGSTGTLNVNGATLTSVDDATILQYGRLGVYAGMGNINITNGGVVNCRLFEGGRVDGSTTNLTVSGSGSTLNCEQFLLGRGNNTQNVQILNGGSVVNLGTALPANNFLMGDGPNVTSNILVSGAGSSIVNTISGSFMALDFTTARCTMTISNGATGNFTFLGVGGAGNSTVAGTGTLVVDHASLTCSGLGLANANVNASSTSTGTATFNASTASISGGLSVAFAPNALSTMTVSNGSTINGGITQVVVAGAAGATGTLNVSSGSLLDGSGANWFIGAATPAVGTVNITGTGTQVLANGVFLSANGGSNQGTASLTVADHANLTCGALVLGSGATVALTGGAVLQTTVVTQPADDSIAHVSIDATSKLYISGTSSGGALMQVVLSGAGTVEINAPLLTEYLDVTPLPFTGTLRATSGSLWLVYPGFTPAATTAGTGTVEALSDGGSIVVDIPSDSPTGQVALQVHTARAVNGGLVQITNSNVMTGALPRVAVTDLVDVGGTTAPTGLIDLTNNDMVVRQSTLAAVTAEIAAYFNGSRTVGIGSSEAGLTTSLDPRDQYATLGVILNSDGMGGALYSTFDTISLTSADVIVKYTYIGDTNLDGVVDAQDLQNLLAGLNGHLTGWENGDLNYDGVVNGTDYNLLLATLQNQGASFGNGFGTLGSGAVPEPAALAPMAGLGMLATRRRRR